MEITDLKNVVGEVKTGEVVKIQFFGHIDQWMASRFNEEFEYLEKYIKPSRIDILINSEGGSVLHGMSSFAMIQNSTIPTRCINEGLAASMASVILVAGNETYMKDYAVIMIHQPFLPDAEDDGKTTSAVKAFATQLETIYEKRFGLPKEKVQEIMAGKHGEDGTYFDANAAVKAGIVAKENVIKTPKQNTASVQAAMKDISSISALQDFFSKISTEKETAFKLCEVENAIHNRESTSEEDTNKTNNITMAEPTKEDKTVGFVEASLAGKLGITAFDHASIDARIADLKIAEASLKSLQDAHASLKTVSEGQAQSIQNLTENLSAAQAKLDAYALKESEAKTAEIQAFVDKAITDGKIAEASKAKWIESAGKDFDLVKSLINDIPAREVISEEIAQDPENAKKAAEGAKTEEQQLQEKVEAVIGADFEFLKS